MDDTISNYIIDHYKNVYPKSDKQIEVHLVYGTEEKNGMTKVFIRSFYQGFNIATGAQGLSGHSLPALITMKKDGNEYKVVEYKEAKDGSDYASSIKRMFPKRFAEMALSNSGNLDEVEHEMNEKVEEWLEEIKQNQKD